MKLHLTTSLRAALLCALCSSAVYAEETTPGPSNKKYEVELITGNSNKLPSNSDRYYRPTDVDEDGGLTLTGNDRMGAFDGDNLITSFGTYTVRRGIASGDLKVTSDGNVTQNVKLDGTLTLEGKAQVVLGGQFQNTVYYLLDTYTESAEYTGIIADKIVVNCENTENVKNLSTWNINVNSLKVQGGTVDIHNCGGYATSGNSYFVVNAPEDSKQARIKTSLEVSGGSVTIGHGGSQATSTSYNHISVAFGDLICEGAKYDSNGQLKDLDKATVNPSSITHTGGTLDIAGKSASVGGMDITQNGGTMNLSGTSHHELSDYGDFVVNQGYDSDEDPQTKPTMTIGKIIAKNDYYKQIKDKIYELGKEDELLKRDLMPSVSVTQTGNGVINLKGVDFTSNIGASTEKSLLKQTADGTINLNGDYLGATFNIEQTGSGKIELASGATMTANQVTVGGTMNVAGSLNLVNFTNTEGETSAAGLTVSGTLNVTGSLTLNGATITLVIDDLSQIVQEATTLAAATGSNALIQVADKATFNATDAKFELLFTESAVAQLQEADLDELKLELISGVDAAELANTQITLSTKGDVTAEDLFGETSYSFSDVTGSSSGVSLDVQSTAAVPEPTTATLSLLALAGLCARRRRR